MGKKITITITMVIIALLTSVTLFFTVAGGFAGNIDKDYFSSVNNYRVYIIFNTPSPDGNKVWVTNDAVKVKIDTSLEGTAISASPSLIERFRGETVFYLARSVTVLVQNEKEKELWEEYIQSVIDKWDSTIQPRTIIPNN